jgi:hypothetical protein
VQHQKRGVLVFDPSIGRHAGEPEVQRLRTYRVVIITALDGGKVNIKFLNDTRIKRIEVHDQDELVPEATLGFEHQTTFEFIAFVLGGRSFLCSFGFHFGLRLVSPGFIGTHILQTMELVQENVLIALSTTTIERFVPNLRAQRWVCGLSELEGDAP